MNAPPLRPPLTRSQVVDRYFLEHRAKVLDLAAFLDRVDRAQAGSEERSDDGPDTSADDPRLPALRDAIALLLDGKPDRARRVLELWSDPTREPIPAAGTKGATGVWPRYHQLAPGL